MKDSKLYGFIRPILTVLVKILYRPNDTVVFSFSSRMV